MKIVSLFSGAGGLDLGLIQAGNEVIWANDIDKDAVATYKENIGTVYISAKLFEDGRLTVRVRDKGCGIPNVEQAMEPLFTTGGSERAGLGFAVMQSFCDTVRVHSNPGSGTSVTLTKHFTRRYPHDKR